MFSHHLTLIAALLGSVVAHPGSFAKRQNDAATSCSVFKDKNANITYLPTEQEYMELNQG